VTDFKDNEVLDLEDSDDEEYEKVTFEYDPYLYEEEDPSQSPWHYIEVESIVNDEGEEVEFDEDQLHELKQWIWEEYKNEI